MEIVEKIALETCDIYQEADKNVVLAMTWLHDYGKMVDFSNQYESTQVKGSELMGSLGFEKDFISKTIMFIKMLDSKLAIDINKAPLEVKILSSADGAAHFVGPFFFLWWYENSNKKFEELMEDNEKKALKDWNKKVVIPEIREKFEPRFKFLLEQAGNLPEKYL
ncbi:MAG: hypothetical protein WC858_05300 [Parcubacteria group bacterium]